MIRLSINIDHFATLRNARGENNPDIIRAAKVCLSSGVVDSITCHLREDRRHIIDSDIYNLSLSNILPLNFEMAATNEMIDIAIKIQPHSICLVPEKRLELTTEGGLDLSHSNDQISYAINTLRKKTNAIISLFVNPNEKSINISKKLSVDAIEIHSGYFAIARSKLNLAAKNKNPNLKIISKAKDAVERELNNIINAARYANKLNLLANAGHGIDFDTAYILAKNCLLYEMSIGHFIVAESLFAGFENTIIKIFDQMKKGFLENNC